MKHRVRKGIAALAIAGAGLGVPAAVASSAGAAGASEQNGLVNVVVTNVANGNHVKILKNVPVSVAAAACDTNVNVLSAQLQKYGFAPCRTKSHIGHIARVVRV